MNIDKVVLVYPKRDGRILGKAQGSPYTLMRLASLVPDHLPVEIWDEDLAPIQVQESYSTIQQIAYVPAAEQAHN